VTDVARGILDATEGYNQSKPVNLGSGIELSIRDLVETIADLTGFKGRIEWDISKPDGQPQRKLDISRAEKCFDWNASTDFEDGLRQTIKWYKSVRDQYPAESVDHMDGSK
jgi:dTDP-glucose 4,6-dehydratase/GDP-L-fucose synthase